MEIKNSTEDKSKVIMIVVAVIFAGALFGVLGYLLGSGNNSDNSKTGNEAENQAVRNQETNQNMETEKEESNGENKEEAENIKDETADWESYKNEKYKYEISYPKNWIVSENDVMKDSEGNIVPNSQNYNFQTETVLKSNTDNKLFKISLYADLKKAQAFKITPGVYQQKKIDTITADMFLFEGGDIEASGVNISPSVFIGFVKNDLFCEITMQPTDKLIGVFDQILSTLKFTTKDVVSDDQMSANQFCQSLVGPNLKLGIFNYYSNNNNEKFADCGIGDDQGGVHIIVKYINGLWVKIWTGNGNISQEDIIKYNIPEEIR